MCHLTRAKDAGMDAPATSPPDPVAIIRQIDAAVIRERLDAMERERQALLVLLRAANRARRPDDTRKAVPA